MEETTRKLCIAHIRQGRLKTTPRLAKGVRRRRAPTTSFAQVSSEDCAWCARARAHRPRRGTKENTSAVALMDDDNLQMPNGAKHCTPRAAERARRADGDDRGLRRAQIEACTEIWRNERS